MVVIAVIALAGHGAWYSLNSHATYFGTPESITFGNAPYVSALIYIADDEGFFAANGLNVTIKNYVTSLAAIDDMKKEKVDISATTEFTVAAEAFKKANISAIGSIEKFQAAYLVARKDRGI